jgi:membrane protease YdiL (CAAX protease family)
MSEPGSSTSPIYAATTSHGRRIFSGRPSVRGAIGVLLYAALALVAFRIQGGLLQRSLPGMDETALYLVGHLVELTEILLFAWAASKIERRSFADYGLPWRAAFRSPFWRGAALGIVSLGVLVFAVAALGGVRIALPEHAGPRVLLVGAGYLAIFIVLGFREEFLYRGYGLSTLAGQVGFWPAAMVSSVWFVFTHSGNSGENPLGLAAVGLFGVFACLLLERTGSLWVPIGFHAAWDWGETFLFGVSDSGHAAAPGHFLTATVQQSAPAWLSGGAAGPEGSTLCLVLLAVLAIVVTKWRPSGESAARS